MWTTLARSAPYAGQFFFKDDPPDRELFRQQTRRYGFDQTEYLGALERTPHLSREMVETVVGGFLRQSRMGLSIMTMNAVEEPAVKLALADTLGRFRSMQVLYENLYSIDAGSSVSIMEYLQAVTEQVLPLFAIAEKVSCTVVLDEPEDEQAALCVLDAKRLSTLGLIVNELLTNSMKHAFHKLDRGVLELRVEFSTGLGGATSRKHLL
ncbi:MAG: PocR ligand-binding domain-containing protein [Spirochaeta sp.]|nr:PocR ligand-binding domain-containing protein [Spirochaeta sp.]